MTPALPLLAAAGIGYLLLLFLIATAVDRGLLPARIARHRIVNALALGVYASSWSFYGSVGFARRQGYLFLTIYLGVTLACLVMPVLWMPILRLVREHQLTSLADLFAFRYRTPWVGAIVTVFMLAGSLPYLALQVRAVTESMGTLGSSASPVWISAGFFATVTLFAILFGANHSLRQRHEGLVFAIAFESVVKLVALLAVGGFAVFGVFGGLGELDRWLSAHPEALHALYEPAREGPWGTLLLLTFSAAFLLPRQFHLAFAENHDDKSLRTASWAFPLFLLLLNLAIPPILWAGTELLPHGDPDFYVIGIAHAKGATLLAVLAFVGGLSAASAMLIVTALALSSMCLNHILLPLRPPGQQRDLYRWLLWARRGLMVAILALGFIFFLLLQQRRGLAELGLVSFVATAQFLPGLFGVLFWRRATRAGFVSGLLAGAVVWAATLLFPLLARAEIFPSAHELSRLLGNARIDPWTFSTFLSLSLNTLLFGVVSVLGRPGPQDEAAAQACQRDTLQATAGAVTATSPSEFQELLVPLLGSAAAELEVKRALSDLGMAAEERRPAQLVRLRTRIETNLSGLIGPVLARVVVDSGLRMDPRARTALASHLRELEEQLRGMRLRGPAAQLDVARRYFRRILQRLPLGICVLGPDADVTFWNRAMERFTGEDEATVIGLRVSGLREAWRTVLSDLAQSSEATRESWLDGRCFQLHRSRLEDDATGGVVLLIADVTDQKQLEAQLAHQDRLASVGRFAAGIAHEVGNPLTAIASLAQNLRVDPDPEVVGERVQLILEQARRIEAIIRSLLRFSHTGELHSRPGELHEPFDLRDAIEEGIRLVHLSHQGRAVRCENECPAGLWVAGDRQQVVQVFVNLLANACDASQPGSRVQVRAVLDGEGARVEVSDHGAGIPDDIRARIFEPFFTTKSPGEGTGLGLTIAWSIVREHRGRIDVASEPGTGTTISVLLPTALRAPATEGVT